MTTPKSLQPKMYEVYAALDVIDRATDEQFNRAYDGARDKYRSPRSRAFNAYKGSKVQQAQLGISKGQRKPKPSGEGWDPEHQIIVTLSRTARKGK